MVDFSKVFHFLKPKGRRAAEASADLRANAEKALRMKQESEPATHIPPHRTAKEGMRDTAPTDVEVDRSQGSFTPKMKRSRVARSGDAS